MTSAHEAPAALLREQGEQQPRLSVLAVDDEVPALDEIAHLLRRSPLVGEVEAVGDATEALRRLLARRFGAVVLDVRMPGLDGIELARLLGRFSEPPAVIFVSGYEECAVDAFDVDAVGYLLKPVDETRLAAALQRASGIRHDHGGADGEGWDLIPGERGRRTLMIPRDDVQWVEAAGDYVRLHTKDERSHLVRIPMVQLQERWSPYGFARIHRAYLVALRSIRELRSDSSQTVVVVGNHELPVSRRHLRELRERLVPPARSRR